MAETASPSKTKSSAQADSWSQVWHLPVLLLGLGLFCVGVYLAMPSDDGPNFPKALDSVAQYLAADNLEEAEKIMQQIEEQIDNTAEKPVLARFWQYRADLNFLQQRAAHRVMADTDVIRQNNRTIVSYYDKSAQMGRTLDATSLRRLAETLVALGENGRALAVVDQLKGQPAAVRYRVVRSMIERLRNQPGPDLRTDAITELMARFRFELGQESDRAARLPQEVWVAALDAKLSLEVGDPEQATDFLLRQIQRLKAHATPRQLAPLYVLLARGYQSMLEFEEAQRYYDFAQQQLDAADALNAEILVGMGQIALADSNDLNQERALNLFGEAVRNYPSEPAYVDALIGMADVEARIDSRRPDAIEHFGLAVDELLEQATPWDPRRERLTNTVENHIEIAWDQAAYADALSLLHLLVPLYGEDMPADLLIKFARTHEAIARQMKSQADGIDPYLPQAAASELGQPAVEARRLLNQKAAQHFDDAAGFYHRHARAVSRSDDVAHGESLWAAAEAYDAAQRWKKAIRVYGEYVKTRGADPRQIEARARLGRAYLADGQYQPALDLFLQLDHEHPNSPHTYDSQVPMARAYMALGDNDAAVRILKRVVDESEAVLPESDNYREALIELGRLYYRMGETQPEAYIDSIEYLTEAVERYHRLPEAPSLRYLLGDAYRRSIGQLQKQLEERQSERERLALQTQRRERLEHAFALYDQVINELEARQSASLTDLEKLYLRNAYFYRADSAFDRGRFEDAIELYNEAARRWERHPASLVALVQIVNAHCELGQKQQARVANDYALWQLERMPDSVFEDKSLPMSRKQWEDWLRWTSEMKLFGDSRATAEN